MALTGEDCYFFYYSTCTKGDQCSFRHCTQALGTETVCTLWKEGRCFRSACSYRHMDIKTDRSKTPCYWESQPGGCTKPHCVFMHSTVQKGRGLLTQKNRSNPIAQAMPAKTATAVSEGEMMIPGQRILVESEEIESIVTPQVAPLVVNPFDEESDADSTTSGSPVKTVQQMVMKAKPHLKAPEPNVISRMSYDRPLSTNEESKVDLGIKSLEDIRQDKLRHAKEVLAEADELLASSIDPKLLPTHSIDDLLEDLDDDVKETLKPQQTTRRIQLSSSSRMQSSGGRNVEVAADSTSKPTVGSRRIIVVDADSSADRPASPPKNRQSLSSRFGSRTVEQSSEIVAEKRVASPKKIQQTVRLRLGDKGPDSSIQTKDDGSGIRSRLGMKHSTSAADQDKKKTVTDIRSRLGLKRQAADVSRDEAEVDEAPSTRIKARLGLVKSAAGDSTKALESRTKKVSPTSRVGIRSRLGLVEPLAADNEDRASPPKQSRLASQRVGKGELKLYRPPGAQENTSPSIKSRLEPLARTSRRTVAVDSSLDDESLQESSAGWGVKTFSEIMAEKRKRRLALLKGDNTTADDGAAIESSSLNPRLRQPAAKAKTKRSISPINFSSKDTETKPQPKKKNKFTPIVFNDVKDSKEETKRVSKPTVSTLSDNGDVNTIKPKKRKFTPIKFDIETEEMPAVTSSTVDNQLEASAPKKKLSLTTRNTIAQQQQSTPKVKSPIGQSLSIKTPPIKTVMSPPIKSSLITSPTGLRNKGLTPPGSSSSSRRSSLGEDRRASITRVDVDDSFLNDVNALLNDDGMGEITETNYDDIEEDDLLNEMEELLA